MLTVKNLIDAFTSDITRMESIVESGCKGPLESSDDSVDKGLPVVGQCTVPIYPIYIVPITSRNAGFKVNPIEMLVDTVVSKMPGEGARSDEVMFYTPDPTFKGWLSLQKDKLPMSAHRENVLGMFEVWVDNKAPNKSDELKYDPGDLLRDFILRADTKNRCKKEGYRYITGASAVGGEAISKPIMVLTRMDCAVEFDVNSMKWNMIEQCPEMSPAYNVTQHKTFLVTAKPGQMKLSGEQVAKMALTVQEALDIMGNRYLESLDSILVPTRFKLLHPMDTRGYFLRKSASYFFNNGLTVHRRTKDSFPIFLHDTSNGKWYQISTGFFGVPSSMLPKDRAVAGTLGGLYEVVYDTQASDNYTYAQLGWLFKVLMGSQYVTENEGVVALNGCMSMLNCFISGVMGIQTVRELEAVNGTRIEDLSVVDAGVDVFSVAFGVNAPCCRSYVYSSVSGSMTVVSGRVGSESSLQAETSNYSVTYRGLASMLWAISEFDIFKNWEQSLKDAVEDMDLVEPGPAYKAFFARAPHVHDPYTLDSNVGVFLDAGGHMYVLTSDGPWFDTLMSAEEAIAKKGLTEFGDFFGGKLYVNLNDMSTFKLSSEFVETVLKYTALYFVPFESCPTVFDYLYNMDRDSKVWMQAGVSNSDSRLVIGNNHMFAYDKDTQMWEFVPSAGYASGTRLGPVYVSAPDNMEFTVGELRTALKSLQALLPSIQFKSNCPHPLSYEAVRYVSDVVPDAAWTLEFGGQPYTSVEGDWAHATTTVENDSAVLQVMDVVTLILGWMCTFASYKKSDGAYTVIADMLGEEMDKEAGGCPQLVSTNHVIFTSSSKCYVSDSGLDDGVGIEEWTRRTGSCVHPVNFNLMCDAEWLPVNQAAEILSKAGRLDDIFQMYTPVDNPSCDYDKRVAGRVSMSQRKVLDDYKPNQYIPYIIFRGPLGTFSTNGFDWSSAEFVSNEEVVMHDTPFGYTVSYFKDMERAPMSTDQLRWVWESFVSACWDGWHDPRVAYYLNRERRR